MADRDEHFNSRIHITGLQNPPTCRVTSDERKTVYVTLTFDKGKECGERVDFVVSGDVDQMKRFAMGLMRVRDVVLLECERVYGQIALSEQPALAELPIEKNIIDGQLDPDAPYKVMVGLTAYHFATLTDAQMFVARELGIIEEMEEADMERAREDEADQWRMNR